MSLFPLRPGLVRQGVMLLCCTLLWVLPAAAEVAVGENADARFDRTGDGLVDAEDWAKMDADERLAYARESLLELGLEPEAVVGGRRTRLDDYLDGLHSVYGR